MKGRDEFPKATKLTVAQRAGYLCSNPGCRRLTIGPHSRPEKALSIGDAGHIKGARGPRFDPSQTQEDRRSESNAIWLCKACHGLVDGDESEFTVEQLRAWKRDVELEAKKQRDSPSSKKQDVPVVISSEDALIMEGFARLEACRQAEAARAAACTAANANKDYAEVLKLLENPLLPVRKQAYERIREHTRCRNREKFIRLLLSKFRGLLGDMIDEDRREILRLLDLAKAWEAGPYLLGYWRQEAARIHEPLVSALRSFFTGELYDDPSGAVELLSEVLLDLASSGKPEQPTGPLLWVVAHATEKKVKQLSADDWARIQHVYSAYSDDVARFSDVRTIQRALGEESPRS